MANCETMAAQNVPIYALKTNTTAQIQTCLRDLFDLPTVDDEELALREAEEAVYQVMLHTSRWSSRRNRRISAACSIRLVEKYNLQSRSTGIEPNRRVRVFKEAAQ